MNLPMQEMVTVGLLVEISKGAGSRPHDAHSGSSVPTSAVSRFRPTQHSLRFQERSIFYQKLGLGAASPAL